MLPASGRRSKKPAKPPTPVAHDHKCSECGHEWPCDELKHRKKIRKTCPVDDAVAVNGEGPRCMLCFSLENARRLANVRGCGTVEDLIVAALSDLKGYRSRQR